MAATVSLVPSPPQATVLQRLESLEAGLFHAVRELEALAKAEALSSDLLDAVNAALVAYERVKAEVAERRAGGPLPFVAGEVSR